MANASKNVDDLIVTINSQEEQLTRYKKRLQDVVIAHKKLMIEKNRLEETLKTVTDVKTTSSVVDDPVSSNYNLEKKVEELKSNVTKLVLSLSSLSDEKCQMEAQFQLERKHLNEKILQLEEKLKHLSTNSKTTSADNLAQMNLESRQRELELSSNIKELQKIINEERRKRENKEFFIGKLKEQLKLTQEKLNEAKESENILRSSLTEGKTQSDDEKSAKKMLENFKLELQLLQEQHDVAMRQEQVRTLKAEEKIRKLAVEHENRVSKLEQKLAQLSDLASRYDKHRQEDQQIILKLKNRLMQLELESSNVKCEDDRIALSEEALIQQLQHIKHQLTHSCKTSFQMDKLKEVLCDGLELVPDSDAKKYKELFFQLKQQYDECQRKNSIDLTEENVTVSKQKIHSLKNKILELESSNSSFQKQIQIERENVDKILEDEQHKWKSKICALESEYHNKLIIMERELEKQRERTTNMLDDKEKQLQYLQQRYFPVYQFSDETATEKKKSFKGMPKRQNSTLIYYLEDAARKEADINRLRKINNELEEKIHEMEKDHFYQTQLYTQLQEELHRLQKEQDGNDDLNKRYLKNVFLNYLNATDSKMKSHMLNAIFAILKFSDIEMSRVLKPLKNS